MTRHPEDREQLATTCDPVRATSVGCLRWGLHRPDSTTADAVLTRVARHDDIVVFDLREPRPLG